MNVKMFGERHTATNALQAFIMQNFDTTSYYYSCLGWKHRRAPQRAEWQRIDYINTLFVFTVRNPYTWVKSMYKEPYYYHHPQITKFPREQFLTHPFEDYEHVLAMWNEKYNGYIRMLNEVPFGVVVRMEDFVADQRKVYDKLCEYLIPKAEFTPYLKYASGYGVSDAKLDKVLSSDITKRETEIINLNIEPALMKYFDYPMNV